MSSKKCLLVVDVQSAMFNLSRPLYNRELLLDNVNKLILKARRENAPIIYIQHCGGEDSIFKKGSSGWNIHPSVSPVENDNVIEKKYSDSFQETGLEEILKKLAIEKIVVCGLVTEGCVDTTIRRAFSLGYKVEAASDCHSTTDSNILTGEQIVKHHNEVFKIFSQVKETKDIIFNSI